MFRSRFLLFLILPLAAFAQAPSSDTDSSSPSTSPHEGSRWLEIDSLSFSMRDRNTANDHGIHMFEFGQHREILDGRFKFDRQGKYSVHFHASSGRYFNWAYADTIGGQFTDKVPTAIGTLSPSQFGTLIHASQIDPEGPTYVQGINSRGAYIFLRQLYFEATPISKVSFEFGSLPIEHGVNTEITSFDDDGYIAGERIRIHDAKHLFFDEVDGTWAYLGDPFIPNFFERGERLMQSNYQQYLAKRKFGKRAVGSADFTGLRGTNTTREAVKISVPEFHVIDTVRGEFYQRMNTVSFYGVAAPAASGFSAAAMKTYFKKLQVEAGYASVDDNYAVYSGSPFLLSVGLGWNSDSFMNGKRAYARVGWKVAPGLTFTGFYTHKTVLDGYSINNHSFNAGFNFEMAELLHSRNWF